MNKEKLYTEEEVKLMANESYIKGAKDFDKYVKGSRINTFDSFWETLKSKQR